MKIQPIEHGLVLNAPTEGYERSPGLHMSAIYNSLFKDLEPKRFAKDGPPDALAMEYGTAFEEELEAAMKRSFTKRLLTGERPGEYAAMPDARIVPVGTPGSIAFSPDYFLHNGVTRLTEFKSTRMTIAKGIRERKFDKWFCQMKAYGKPLQMPDTRLYALFINGTGKWESIEVPELGVLPPGPLLLSWDIAFSQRELDDNWNNLMRHARKKGMIE